MRNFSLAWDNPSCFALLFAVYLAVAMLFSTDQATSLRETAAHIFGIGVYFAIIRYDSDRVRNTALFLMLLYILSVSLVGNYQIITAYLKGGWDSIMSLRVKSYVSNPNRVARHIIAGIPILMAFLMYKGSYKKKLIYFLALLSLIVTLVFTGSRGAILAVGFSLLVVAFLIKDLKIRLTIIALIVMVCTFGFEKIMTRMVTVVNMTDMNNLARIDAWVAAARVTVEYPLFGIGLGNFGSFFMEYSPHYSTCVFLPHAHNTLLVFSSETGLLGAIIFSMLLLSVLILLLKSLKCDEFHPRLKVILLGASLLSQVLFGMVEYMFTNFGMVIIFYITIGLIVSYSKRMRITM